MNIFYVLTKMEEKQPKTAKTACPLVPEDREWRGIREERWG